MREIEDVAEMQRWADRQRALGLRISFVPTMGYLHEGHLSLVRRGALARLTASSVSIFVNPIQFDREEDLSRTRASPSATVVLLEDAGVDVLFAPHPREMYPDEFVDARSTSSALTERTSCGAHRPGHFRGVDDGRQQALPRRQAARRGVRREGLPAARGGAPHGARSRLRHRRGRARPCAKPTVSRCRAATRASTRRVAARRAACRRPWTQQGSRWRAGARSAEEIGAAVAHVVAGEPRRALEYAVLCDPVSLEPAERVDAATSSRSRSGSTACA
jgi:pantoate--beta-alanine ligase